MTETVRAAVPTPRRHRPAQVSIVVPTYNEGENVAELVRQLAASMHAHAAEIIFIDDSTDDTPALIAEQIETAQIPVRMIHRSGAERVGGLSGAVTAGIRASDAQYVVVMDGDLQHPPTLVPFLVDTARAEQVDMVVASRYCGGDADGLANAYRRMVSSGSTLLARALFPLRVGRRCTDPMTGFFCVARSKVDLTRLNPRGFKILFELLVKHDFSVRELPFSFGERFAGQSKASWRQGLEFVRQLTALRMTRMIRFGMVGASGFVLNLGIMAALVHGGNLNYVLASILATEAAIVSNFLLQERYVFHDNLGSRRFRHRAFTSMAFNNVEHLARIPFLVLLVEVLGMSSILAQALSLAVAFVGRFLFVTKVVYKSATPARALATDVPSARHGSEGMEAIA